MNRLWLSVYALELRVLGTSIVAITFVINLVGDVLPFARVDRALDRAHAALVRFLGGHMLGVSAAVLARIEGAQR